MKFSISILRYLGKLKGGIIVLLSIVYNKKYYEATFYYNAEDILLTISDNLEKILGHKITEDSEYVNILKDILKKITPYNEINSKIPEILE